MTVGAPGERILPVGLGIGATQPECAVISFTLAAGMFPIMTVPDPIAIVPGAAPQGIEHGDVVSPTRAAGLFSINTVASPFTIDTGTAGCGTGVGTGAAGWIGA